MLRLNMRDLLGETPARQSSGTHPSQKICSKAIWCRADKRKEIPNRLINNTDNTPQAINDDAPKCAYWRSGHMIPSVNASTGLLNGSANVNARTEFFLRIDEQDAPASSSQSTNIRIPNASTPLHRSRVAHNRPRLNRGSNKYQRTRLDNKKRGLTPKEHIRPFPLAIPQQTILET